MFIVSPPTRANLHGVDHDVDCGVGHDEDVADVGDDVLHQAHHGLPRHNRQPRDQLLDITQMLEINFDIDTIGMHVHSEKLAVVLCSVNLFRHTVENVGQTVLVANFDTRQ